MPAAWLSDWAPSLARRYVMLPPRRTSLGAPRPHARHNEIMRKGEWNNAWLEVRSRLCYSKTPPLPSRHSLSRQNPNDYDCRIVVATKPKLHTACTIDYECIISDQTRSNRASPLSFKAKSPCVAFALSFPIEVREEPHVQKCA